jgi:L-lysine 2,3-aminomutase
MAMAEKEILDGIDELLQEVFTGGDPWTLSDEGIMALMKRMDAARDALVITIENIRDAKKRTFALKAVHELLLSITDTIKYFHSIELARVKQARIAQTFNKIKAAERQKRLLACIEDEVAAEKRTLSKGLKFAQIIRPGVRRRLGLEPDKTDWPSASTIKAAVMKIKSTS